MATNPSNGNTYFLDAESPAEMARLVNLGRITTQAMGGALVGLEEETQDWQRVLDLGCGPGGWVLDVAYAHQSLEVAGVDISQTMIKYANARAKSQGLSNASFGVMDISQPLDFSEQSFDLVNARFLVGVIGRKTWPALIAECTRILRPGGILRLTEMIDAGVSTSSAFEQINAWLSQAFWRAGYGFSSDGRHFCMTSVLKRLLRDAGYEDIQHAAHALEVSVDAPAWMDFYRNAEVGYYLVQPFLLKAGVATQEEIERIYQQMLIEMRADDYCGMWHYMTFWGKKPAA
ncbi:class I SAM-dependent methyltransferase [Ktedonosporobacter rubrisoli]|uniref:Class I SAM-dependent methyltransferase n=1 Tax=Ktedonosporobacter rubrisoli TaxID=2509675 RepID=A0A4P6K463_KTERU|nr:class I SAM-dependent methyltransferase [Ktedonosporobacter rubrisoli]QBD83087.1 class I SAM-dependent methyltransferase [Ktedonosporobacter rubrisoli]